MPPKKPKSAKKGKKKSPKADKSPKSDKSEEEEVDSPVDVGFNDDFADDSNFFKDYTTDEEEEDEEATQIKSTSFWKVPEPPEKYPLDRVNVEYLVNMLSKIHLVWPEDLPYYDETEYSTDPSRAKTPSSFYHNTPKEKIVLWHAENFRRQYLHKFPDRRPLVIAPRNECDCQKLFPTFINPTTIGYPEFLDCITTVEFLREFFSPQLMEPPTKVPERIRSHVAVIEKRNATSYEMAIIAVSSLIGSGYDAYVMDGYCSRLLCTIDISQDYEEPPEKQVLGYEIDDEEEEAETSKMKDYSIDYGYILDRIEEAPVPTVPPEKYRFKRKEEPDVDVPGGEVVAAFDESIHGFDLFEESVAKMGVTGIHNQTEDEEEEDEEDEEEEEEEEDTKEDEEVDEDEEEEDEEEEEEEEEEESLDEELPPNAKDRYHGKRSHAWILILPGKRDVETPFFLEPFSGTRREIRDPNFLGVEAVFNHKNYWINIQPPAKSLKRLNYNLDDPSAWSKLLVEPEKKKKTVQTVSTTTTTTAFDDEEEEDTSAGKIPEIILTMPVSWTTNLEISQEDYDRRFPSGKKTIEHNDAVVELAAPYVNEDGLVRKVLKFFGASRDPEDLEYIEEKFEHRKDKLSTRKWLRNGKMLHEQFLSGRRDALKEHVHVSGRNKPDYPRDLYYYANAHPQSVSHRQIIKRGMIEHFEGREDLLYYKLTLFGGIICNTKTTKEEEQRSKAREIMDLVKGGGGSSKRPRRKIVKIVEKFHRNESKPANEDIAERHLLIEEGRIRILYHYTKGNFSRNTLEFFKNPKTGQAKYAPVEFLPEDCIEYNADMTAEPMDVYTKFLLLQQMERAERSSSALSRLAEDEVFETVTSRVQEDWFHEITPDAHTGDRNEMMKDQNEGGFDLSGTDFTTPFFEKYGVPRNKKEEILMKKRIMLHEKVRILRRAYMIKELYEKEAAQLRERQQWYAKNVEQMNPTQEEGFAHLYKDRLFKMHIMEQRMIRHQQEMPRQYYNLLVQLLRHPQLNRFTNKKLTPPPIPERKLSPEEKARIAKELAKLKDCCQFYNLRFETQKQKRKPKVNEDLEDEDETAEVSAMSVVAHVEDTDAAKKKSQADTDKPVGETADTCF